MSDKEVKVETNEVQSNPVKTKKPYEMTEARKAAFERCVQARRESAEFRKIMKSSPEFKEAKRNMKQSLKNKIVELESEKSDEEVQEKQKAAKETKKPRKATKPVKKAVPQQSESESESEEVSSSEDSVDSEQIAMMKHKLHTKKRMKLSHERLYGPGSSQGNKTKFNKDSFVFL